MYKEVALDPSCLVDFHYYGLLKTAFGFEKGRYVIAPVRNWAQQAFHYVKHSELQDVKKKSITNYLNKLQKSKDESLILLPKYRQDTGKEFEANWIQWLEHQLKLRDFSSVVSENLGESAISYNQLIEEHPAWKIPPSIRINKKAQDILEAISPVFYLSEKILIVDQYFKLSSNPVLTGVFSLLQQLKYTKSLTLVTSIETLRPLEVFQNEYANKFDFIPNFKLIVAPERYFHDRYIITEKAAIKSGQGFSQDVIKGTQADRLSINLAGIDECDETRLWVGKVVEDGKASCIELKK
ncbi:hypothetical protein N480_09770 [Pseudoalteromonas luteoviolacea S2607]|uniref:hypothetical protein n=1 Tax=Pseudoalteromonas luteoviolacea TaxID=43657 RepID=UPI0007B09FC2|nr:hypothetical protein [Pseudoalteromonas luteoviolacea]KZN29046.1 hypothetical protein N480_09770 [Pseudoalteromonas luteoviolacea S2607]